MKNKMFRIVAFIFAVLMVVGTFLYMRHRKNSEPVSESLGISVPVIQPEEKTPPVSSDLVPIPDMSPGEDSSPRIYEKKDIKGLSSTTLSENEIIEDIEKTLAGLLTLDDSSIARISAGTVSGEYNPTRYMLEAASQDNDLREFFLNVGAASSFSVLGISESGDYPNMYTVRVKCNTPYMQSEAQSLVSLQQPLYYNRQKVPFSGSGAAKKISDMDLNNFPLMTDIISIGVLVEDDIPYLYHPISENYGSRIPQYAFLWGGIIFKGIENGDLLLDNYLGGMTQLDDNDVQDIPRAADVSNYADSVMKNIKMADFGQLRLKVFGDANLQDEWFFSKIFPAYEKAMEQYDGFRDDCLTRLKSMDYKVSVYSTFESASTSLAAIQVEYSVNEPSSGGIAYYSVYHVFDAQRKSKMKGTDAQMVNAMMSDIMERAIGGDRNQLDMRLRGR